MRDVPGKGADKNQAVLRPTESDEHPGSGVPQHDLTGGNVFDDGVGDYSGWITYLRCV